MRYLLGVCLLAATGLFVLVGVGAGDAGTAVLAGGGEALVLQFDWVLDLIETVDRILEAVVDLLETVRRLFGGVGGGD